MANAFWKATLGKTIVGLIPSLFGFVRSLFGGKPIKDAAKEAGEQALPVLEETAKEIVDETISKNTKP